jgi:HD-GYP domain-containing protein (c-di-GMP phosphodiesterase class II)
MRQVAIDELIGNEILAVPVMSRDDKVLIQSDTTLRDDFIARLRDYGVDYVYIKDAKEIQESKEANADEEKAVYTIEETFEESEKVIKKVLSKHIYKHNEELKKISEQAEAVIDNILSESEIVESVTEIRNISTDMYSHCLNVCILSTIMAIRLKMNERQIRNVSKGAILHDIGLKFITSDYIDRDESEMTPDELLEYRKHTVYGYSSVQEEEWLPDPVKEIILLHHEQLDGEGFPFKQKGDKLRNEVKLVALCDEFDSLISGIGGKKVKMYEAIESIKAHVGTKFDRTIAAKFLETVAAYPVGDKVVLSNGEVGEVIRQNREAMDRPVIRVTELSDGTACEEKEVDLLKALTLFIVDTL